MTPSVPLSFYAQLLPLPKPLLLLPTPHPSPLPPNKNFGRRLDPRGALLIDKDRGLSPSKNSSPQKSKNLSFCKPKKVNSWNFQTQKSKLLYFEPVLPECCSSRSLQIIFMALATVFRITLAFWNYCRKFFAIRYLVEALLVRTVNFSHYWLVNGQEKANRKGLVK